MIGVSKTETIAKGPYQMAYRLTVTLDEANYAFLQSVPDQSAYVNRLVEDARARLLADRLEKANREEAETAYQAELSDWESTLGDGLL